MLLMGNAPAMPMNHRFFKQVIPQGNFRILIITLISLIERLVTHLKYDLEIISRVNITDTACIQTISLIQIPSRTTQSRLRCPMECGDTLANPKGGCVAGEPSY